MVTRKTTRKTTSGSESAKDRKERRKDQKVDKQAAKIRRYDAKTEARKKAGGAGMSITFYEIAMPDGSKARVQKGRK